MRLVEFFIMRHGKKNDDDLTERGCRQVEGAARLHLNRIKFTAAFCSPKKRTGQAVEAALQVINQDNIEPVTSQDFWYDWLGENFEAALDEYVIVEQRIGDTATVQVWLDNWAPAKQMRQILTATLIRIAENLPGKNNSAVLVGCHQVLAELAVLDPATTTVLDFADIVRYVVEITDEGIGRLIASEILKAPTVE